MTDTEIQDYEGFSVEYKDASHRYWLHNTNPLENGERKPAISVTSALSILDKPALRRWQGNEDATAVLGLERDGELRGVPTDKAIYVARERGYGAEALRDKGGARGTAVHEALSLYCSERRVPNLSDFSDEARGYVQAACDWLLTVAPEPLIVERIVGSPKHGFAGRFDLIAWIPNIPGGLLSESKRTLIDFKTSANAGLYPESHIQLAGYQLAFEECGIEPVDRAIIVSLDPDGFWKTTECKASAEDFLSVLEMQKRLSMLKKALKPAKASA